MWENKEVNMPELTKPQTDWLKNLLRSYFPYIDKNYQDYIEEIFIEPGYLHFAKNQELKLPRHLQYPYAIHYGNESIPVAEMELDIPAMLENEPFFSLIKNRDYLDDLKAKVIRERFDLFVYVAKKIYNEDICNQAEKFETNYMNTYGYDHNFESVPELFVKQLIHNKKKLAEYNFENNSFFWDYFFDYKSICLHKVGDIGKSFWRFALKEYHIRSLAIPLEVAANINEIFRELIDSIPLISNINNKVNNYVQHNFDDRYLNMRNCEYNAEQLLVAFNTLFLTALETNGHKYNDANKYYIKDPKDLLFSITYPSSTVKKLARYAKREFDPEKVEYENIIRGIFNKIQNYLAPNLLSEEDKLKLIEAHRGGVNERLLALLYMYDRYPDTHKILNRENLLSIHHIINKSSLDAPIKSYSNDGETTEYERLNNDEEMVAEDRSIINLIVDDISNTLKNHFPNPQDSLFVEEILYTINIELNREASLKLSDLNNLIEKIDKNNLTIYEMTGTNNRDNMYNRYKMLRGLETSNCLTESEFREVMRIIVVDIKNALYNPM